jgi:hypothetical protein
MAAYADLARANAKAALRHTDRSLPGAGKPLKARKLGGHGGT